MPSLDVKDSRFWLAPRELADLLDPAQAQDDITPSKGDCVDILTRMVEGEIIPRLLLAHGARSASVPRASDGPGFGADAIEAFAQAVLSNTVDTLMGHVSSLLEQGTPVQSIYLDLLAPTARKLGEYWTSDYCSFADVTIGLGKLQQILHELGRRDVQTSVRPGRSALFAAAPGEQHTFGLLVIEEFFRRAGWRTWCEPRCTAPELAQMVAAHWYDIVGLSVGCEARLDDVAAGIAMARKASKNRAIRVLVGGRVFTERPELAVAVGADVTAADGAQAVVAAENAVCLLEGRC